MDKMNDAKDEAFAKGEEIDELRTQLRKAEVDKNRSCYFAGIVFVSCLVSAIETLFTFPILPCHASAA